MIEVHENVDLVTLRRQGDLEASREAAAEASRARAAAAEEETVETDESAGQLAEPRTAVPPETAVPERIGSETLVYVALAVALILAAVGMWWRGDRRKR